MEAPELVRLLDGRRVVVLTGAGLSTDSGIPDYRGPDSPPSNPMTIRQFTSNAAFRQRYWARNHVGWRHMDDTLPMPVTVHWPRSNAPGSSSASSPRT